TPHRVVGLLFFFSSRRRHTSSIRDWRSDVCSSDLGFFRSLLQWWKAESVWWFSVPWSSGPSKSGDVCILPLCSTPSTCTIGVYPEQTPKFSSCLTYRTNHH